MLPSYWEKASFALKGTIALDFRWMGLAPDLDETLAAPIARAFADVHAVESGAIANADEGRMVGHYWLRAPNLAPGDLGPAINASVVEARAFCRSILDASPRRFDRLLVVGIGGSALGPNFVIDALGDGGGLDVSFMDNTDPDGMDRILKAMAPLDRTLVAVISKSGTTPETFNGMVITQKAYADAGVDFDSHAVAITVEKSFLHRLSANWLARFPLWDWVGGRSSVTGTVGLVPAGLAGIDTASFLAGAGAMDAMTRVPVATDNPAMLLALAWYGAGNGRGDRAMVVLPYKDRLVLLSRYLQQLIMESLGKRFDRAGAEVWQGLTVYGNKGSTDQHAYVQQLREGRDDFFATFIEVLHDGVPDGAASVAVKRGELAGDHLSGFLAGTRAALHENGRPSLTITIDRVDAASVGALVALFERAVSLYASLIDVNAYHQPGVEAGKVAAAKLMELQSLLLQHLADGNAGNADTIAAQLGAEPANVFHLLRHLAANGRVRATGTGLERVFSVA